jgi:hypothetical protein
LFLVSGPFTPEPIELRCISSLALTQV